MSLRSIQPHLAATGVAIGLYLTTKIKRNGYSYSSPWFFPIYDWVLLFYHKLSFSKWSQARTKALGNSAFYVTLFGIHQNPRNTLLITDAEEHHDIISKATKIRLMKDLPSSVDLVLGTGSLQHLDVEDHQIMRRLFGGLIAPRALESFLPHVQSYITAMFDSVTGAEKEVKLETYMGETLLNIYCKLFYGLPDEANALEEGHIEFNELKRAYQGISDALLSVPHLSTFNNGVKDSKTNRDYLGKRFEAVLAARKAAYSTMEKSSEKTGKPVLLPIGNAMETVADSLIEQGTEYEGKVEDMIKNNLSFLLLGSHSTTTTTSMNLLYQLNLPQNASALAKLREEISSIKKGMNGSNLSFDTIKAGMPYTEACIKEGLRINPLIVFFPYKLEEGSEIEFRGKTLKGPMGIMFERSKNFKDSSIFPRADEFLPERWLETTDSSLRVTQRARRAYKPFGAGRRTCLGERLANLNLKVILYCFASDPNRFIEFDTNKVKIAENLFPASEVTGKFPCFVRTA